MISSDIGNVQSDAQNKVISRYIRGIGVEIVAFHPPLDVPENVQISYTGKFTENMADSNNSRLIQIQTLKSNVDDESQTLNNVDDEKFDFCIANHVIEYMENPRESIINWFRILKPGGILYISTMENPENRENDFAENYLHLIECDKKFQMEQGNSLKVLEKIENQVDGLKEHIYILEKEISQEKIKELLGNRKVNDNAHFKAKVDVIVPVYNAYDHLLKCLYSLVKYQKGYRIILINDKSTDENICDLFSQLKGFESNDLIILENDNNKGFVGTVNRGMKYSKDDVILLNSDTIVTKDWAVKLINCAYSDSKIGTVTPFTNNGTICSIPNFFENNVIPDGFTIDYYADFVEKISLEKFPEIPTAVGFCMYIKRELLKKIGFFDEETFGKGYEEENDFCMRAICRGYKTVLCDNTFVFHNGEASFSESKKELADKNHQILVKRYPDYDPMIADFCHSNPLSDLHSNIKLREKTWDFAGKKRILYILHHSKGETEKHIYDLINNIKGYVFYVARIIGEKCILAEVNNGSLIRYQFNLDENIGLTTFHSEKYRALFEKIINTFEIDIIHVHHLLGHTLDIFDVANENNIPILFTIHDFYSVCPRINLLDNNLNYCHNQNDIEKCTECLMETSNSAANLIHIWRSNFNEIFKKCDMIIVSSNSTIKILSTYYSDIEQKCSIVGNDICNAASNKHNNFSYVFQKYNMKYISNIFTRERKDFHIAYIGVFAPPKGQEIFYELANSGIFKENVKWSVFGSSNIPTEKGYHPNSNIHFYEKYDDFDHLKEIVQEREVDLVVLPAIWPETFSDTLFEAWALKIPVVTSDLGVLEELVRTNGGGWIIDFSNIEQAKKQIRFLSNRPLEYYKKKKEVQCMHLKTIQEISIEHENIYNRFTDKLNTRIDNMPIYFNEELLLSICNDNMESKYIKQAGLSKQDVHLI